MIEEGCKFISMRTSLVVPKCIGYSKSSGNKVLYMYCTVYIILWFCICESLVVPECIGYDEHHDEEAKEEDDESRKNVAYVL
jgi:hypothetical protein